MIWTAYSRQHRRVIAYHVGDTGVHSAITIYTLAKAAVGQIGAIFTDANSCYHLAFERIGAPEPHQQTKAQTHLIEFIQRLVPRYAGSVQPANQASLEVPADARDHPRHIPRQKAPRESDVNSPPSRGG